MTYNYEALNGISFQKLAQALIVAKHPDTACLPVPQPDGGRDAFLYLDPTEKAEFVVFQAKFTNDPKAKTERDLINEVIKSERGKVENLIAKGATHFYLITNVSGTAHPNSGSIDKVNKTLKEEFSIPSYVWWRDDLDAQLNGAADIKWSFTEILRASDVLQILVERPGNNESLESVRAIAAYIGQQYGVDRDIKFKQVELKRRITDLFVDIPIGLKGGRDTDSARQRSNTWHPSSDYLDQLDIDDEIYGREEHPFEHCGLAAAFLLQTPFKKGVSRLVLEGAPGQGKSTVTQFLCQVNRLKLLPQTKEELQTVADIHRGAPTRTPFRVDLRDFAGWLSGRHPYANADETPTLGSGERSLESFLTMQIEWNSGGLKLTQNHLLQFFMRAHSMIVLDGFDEVADTLTRTRIVDEICAAADRLDAHALSMQIIVTSRPAAFANSPGFPQGDWAHLELNDLNQDNIEAYQLKWGEAQELTRIERDVLAETLKEKLNQPHLRDLARNPMQLAILLQLMHVQGAALPDKRTAMYDEYMKIFLNREVEKKQIEADHRELILALHGLLAWLLQVQAEKGEGSGSITLDNLRSEIKTYLETQEYDTALSESLLKGTVERVGALVSRVQGTFEFEVQPLREYFAARHLHKTAPYSPPGRPRSGTRPDRFAALASSYYWTNVTRFYCGFYDKGELASLVDGLTELEEQEGYATINHPRRLAMMLLSDLVFSESPKTMRRLIKFIVEEPGFQKLAASELTRNLRSMTLPETAGRNDLFAACAAKLASEDNEILRRMLRRVMAANGDVASLKSTWKCRYREQRMICHPLTEAVEFGVVHRFSVKEIELLTNDDIDLRLKWLCRTDRYEDIVESSDLYEAAKTAYFSGDLIFSYRRFHREKDPISLEVLTELIRPEHLVNFFRAPSSLLAINAVRHRRGFGQPAFLEYERSEPSAENSDPIEAFARFVADIMSTRKLLEWHGSLDPWSAIVDEGFSIAPNGLLFATISILATAVSLDNENYSPDEFEMDETEVQKKGNLGPDRGIPRGLWSDDAFSSTPGLVSRLYYARERAEDTKWWSSQFQAQTGDARFIFLAMFACWGGPKTVASLSQDASLLVDDLDAREWYRLWRIVMLGVAAAGRQPHALGESWYRDAGNITPRLSLLLSFRVFDEEDRRAVGRLCFYEYDHGDNKIIGRAAEWELQTRSDEDIDWHYVLRLSRLARRHGMRNLLNMGRLPTIDVPYDIAHAVLDECEQHAGELVAECERTIGLHIAQSAPKVSDMANRDNWFAPDSA